MNIKIDGVDKSTLSVVVNTARTFIVTQVLPAARVVVRKQEENEKLLEEIRKSQRRIEAKVDELAGRESRDG